jgi:adenylosuccinate lyase
MIERYALPEMSAIFSEARRLELWTRIELLAAEGWFRSGRIPEADWQSIRAGIGTVNPDRMREIEEESQHDILAFLRTLTEGWVGGRWLRTA